MDKQSGRDFTFLELAPLDMKYESMVAKKLVLLPYKASHSFFFRFVVVNPFQKSYKNFSARKSDTT